MESTAVVAAQFGVRTKPASPKDGIQQTQTTTLLSHLPNKLLALSDHTCQDNSHSLSLTDTSHSFSSLCHFYILNVYEEYKGYFIQRVRITCYVLITCYCTL